MKKFVCAVCGWTTEAEVAPAECPICKAKKFIEQEAGEKLVFADEHKVGICEGIDPEIVKGLRGKLQRRMHRSWDVFSYGSCSTQRRLSRNRSVLGKSCL